MNKLIFSLAGAVTVIASAMALIEYKNRRDVKQFVKPPVGEFWFVVAAAASGTVMATIADQLDQTKHPERAQKLQAIDTKLEQLCQRNKKSNDQI